MKDFIKTVSKCLVSATLAVSCVVAADTRQLQEAVNRYYAGFTDQAIDMIEPLALAGDVDAQYLLGNILYSLSNTGKVDEIDDSVKWYKMAAVQKSIGANYALGAIFHNRWLKSRNNGDAAMAIVYYQNAVDLGYKKAQTPLTTILSRSRVSRQQAEALVKQQRTDPKPASSVTVQPIASQAVKPIVDETPVVEAASKPTAGSETTTSQSASTKLPTSVAKIPATETMPETNVFAVEAEAGADSPDPVATAGPAGESEDEMAMTITLADFANQCANYTEVGFRLYAQTIKGAVLSGKAPLVDVQAESSSAESYSIVLSAGEAGTEVLVNLREVPKEMATRYKQGDKFPAMGIIVDSKLSGSRCVVSLAYQAEP